MKVIYAILNNINGKRYVGSAKNFYVRKRIHLRQLRKGTHHCLPLQRAWDKYGEDNFSFIVIENVETNEMLLPREQWWFNNTKCEYNICKIAGSSLGVKRSKETREKCRKAHLGEKHPEWRNQIKSKAQGGENHWTKKKKFSEESKKKMSESQKALYKNGYTHPNKVAILQFNKNNEFIREWSCIREAADFYKVDRRAIGNCCRKISNTSAGFIWRYKNE